MELYQFILMKDVFLVTKKPIYTTITTSQDNKQIQYNLVYISLPI